MVLSADILQKNTTRMIYYIYLLSIFTRVSSLAVSIVSAREVLSDITASSTGNCAVASTCLFKTNKRKQLNEIATGTLIVRKKAFLL